MLYIGLIVARCCRVPRHKTTHRFTPVGLGLPDIENFEWPFK